MILVASVVTGVSDLGSSKVAKLIPPSSKRANKRKVSRQTKIARNYIS